MESSAVVQRTRDGSAETTVATSAPSPSKASTPGCTTPLGPIIHSVARSPYVTEPDDASRIRRPVRCAQRRGRATGEHRPDLLDAVVRRVLEQTTPAARPRASVVARPGGAARSHLRYPGQARFGGPARRPSGREDDRG